VHSRGPAASTVSGRTRSMVDAKSSRSEELELRRPQRAVRPIAGLGVVQRVIVAIGADVSRPPSEASSDTAFIGLPHACRARLPERVEHGHLFFPCDGTLVQPRSRAQADRRNPGHVHALLRAFLTPRPQSTQLLGVILRGVSWSRSSTEVWPKGSGVWRRRLIRSPGVVSWISPSGMTSGAASPRHPDRTSDRCQRLARARLHRASPD
jgi:hypothetical protein